MVVVNVGQSIKLNSSAITARTWIVLENLFDIDVVLMSVTMIKYSLSMDIATLIAEFMGQHGAHLDPVGPRWAPCWPQ